MGIKEGMPLLARHEGEWRGEEYLYVDAPGGIVDQHRSHLRRRFPPAGEDDYLQVKLYTWADGYTEEHEFPGSYDGFGRMTFDTGRIRGMTRALDENTIYPTWIYKSAGPGVDQRLFELIVLSQDGRHRSQVWQWLEYGVCVRRTLINETKVA
jgi:hypothetical protein